MSRFLFTCWPFPGHLYPLIAVALELRRRGHECAFYTGNAAAGVLAGEGFRHFPFQSVDEKAVHELLFSSQREPTAPSGGARFVRLLREWMLETVPGQIEDVGPIVETWRPEVIVTDPSMWSGPLILREKMGLPVAISSFIPACMIPGPDAPPFGLGLRSPRTWWSRLLATGVSWGQNLVAGPFRRRASELRRLHGLPPLASSVLAHSATVPLYLVPSAPEFDYQRRDLPACVRYVGPCLWNRPSTLASPPWFDSLSRDRPWVHGTEGTVHVEEPFVLRACVDGLGDLDVEVILTTGGGRSPEELNLGPTSANIHIARWISHSDLLPRTDVMVTTGGAGSVLAALAAGVPLVLIPTEWDKPEIAQRVVESGAGIRIAPNRCNGKTVRAAVERVFNDSSFRRNARRLAKIFAELGGAGRAAELIEGLANGKGV